MNPSLVAPAVERSPHDMGRASILLVDDDQPLRSIIQQMLETAGYTVAPANHGREAVTLLETQAFDVVLTDLIMPRMDGIEVLVYLRRHHPAMPVLAMSGGGRLAPGRYLQMARDSGARALLEKPFSADQLLLTIEHALATSIPLPV